MNFYPFHIGDFKSHTDHLSQTEELAYRRMLDRYYLHEKPLPNDIEFISKRIKIQDLDAIESVLTEFFTLTDNNWHNSRADNEIEKFQKKSLKAKESAEKRWNDANALPSHSERNANAMPTQCEGNATKTKTKTNTNTNTNTKFIKPTPEQVRAYGQSINFDIDAERFVAYYDSNGWMVGKNKMRDWKATVVTWKRNQKHDPQLKAQSKAQSNAPEMREI